MANPIQRLVSKKKRRYQLSGYDLDLTFITENIIAMGFPAEKIEGLYRNHIDDVASFLERLYPMRYMVFNLCSERDYPAIKFQNRVKKIPFDDHNPPKFTQIGSFCEAAKGWLAQGKEYVVAVHCKAGKGRTGVMICCYLLHDNIVDTDAQGALQFYDEKRTSNKKGVTIPSQRRYVHYYGHYLHLRSMSDAVAYTELSLYLTAIHLQGIHNSTGIGGCTTVYFTVHEYTSKLLTSNVYDLRRAGLEVVLDLDNPAAVQGDVKVEFFSKTPLGKERLFHCWFNTFFIIHSPPKPADSDPYAAGLTRSCLPEDYVNGSQEGDSEESGCINGERSGVLGDGYAHHLTLTLQQLELDRANKDKTHSKFPHGFKVTLHFICKGCHQCSAAHARPGGRPNGSVARGVARSGPPALSSSSFHLPTSSASSASSGAAAAPHRQLVPRRTASAAAAAAPRPPASKPSGPSLLLPPGAGGPPDVVDSDAADDHLSETDPEDEEPWTTALT